MERTFRGLNRAKLNGVLNVLCDLREKFMNLTEEEKSAYEVGIQCTAQILVRMNDNKPINWDRKE